MGVIVCSYTIFRWLEDLDAKLKDFNFTYILRKPEKARLSTFFVFLPTKIYLSIYTIFLDTMYGYNYLWLLLILWRTKDFFVGFAFSTRYWTSMEIFWKKLDFRVFSAKKRTENRHRN